MSQLKKSPYKRTHDHLYDDNWVMEKVVISLFVGLFLGAIFISVLSSGSCSSSVETCKRDLGQAICENKYGLDYYDYSVGKLVCIHNETLREDEKVFYGELPVLIRGENYQY